MLSVLSCLRTSLSPVSLNQIPREISGTASPFIPPSRLYFSPGSSLLHSGLSAHLWSLSRAPTVSTPFLLAAARVLSLKTSDSYFPSHVGKVSPSWHIRNFTLCSLVFPLFPSTCHFSTILYPRIVLFLLRLSCPYFTLFCDRRLSSAERAILRP